MCKMNEKRNIEGSAFKKLLMNDVISSKVFPEEKYMNSKRIPILI